MKMDKKTREWLISTLHQAVYAEVGHVIGTRLTRQRIKEIKRTIIQTLRDEATRLGMTPPEGGWKDSIKDIVGPAVDAMAAKTRARGKPDTSAS